MAIVKSKGKQAGKGNASLKEMYSQAINGEERFTWLAPAHYELSDLQEAYENKKLYRPLAKSFGLV